MGVASGKFKVHSRSVDPWKLCSMRVAISYTPLSMAYYAYDSTANSFSLGSTVLMCISKERYCKEKPHGVGNFPVIN